MGAIYLPQYLSFLDNFIPLPQHFFIILNFIQPIKFYRIISFIFDVYTQISEAISLFVNLLIDTVFASKKSIFEDDFDDTTSSRLVLRHSRFILDIWIHVIMLMLLEGYNKYYTKIIIKLILKWHHMKERTFQL